MHLVNKPEFLGLNNPRRPLHNSTIHKLAVAVPVEFNAGRHLSNNKPLVSYALLALVKG